jgi:hypothetical protein
MHQNAPSKPSVRFPQSFSPEMISNANSLATEYPLISAYEYDRVIPITIGAKLCRYCQKLALDILADPAAPTAGWETIRSDTTLSYLKERQYGTKGSLLQSAKGGCQLCALLLKQFPILDEGPNAEHEYHIFNWIEVPKKCEFLLGLGNISRWLKDISLRDYLPTTFTFFRRNGSDTNWSNQPSTQL